MHGCLIDLKCCLGDQFSTVKRLGYVLANIANHLAKHILAPVLVFDILLVDVYKYKYQTKVTVNC